MNGNTLVNWLNEADENKRLFAQEGLILEATEAIWEALQKRGWTKVQLAEALGTSKSNVTQLLNGSRNMTLRTLSDIAYCLNLVAKVRLCEKREHHWETVEPRTVFVRRVPTAVKTSSDSADAHWTELPRIAS